MDPAVESIEFARVAVGAFAGAGYARTPAAAVGILRTMVSKLIERMTGMAQDGTLTA
jgi:hypothetical protein